MYWCGGCVGPIGQGSDSEVVAEAPTEAVDEAAQPEETEAAEATAEPTAAPTATPVQKMAGMILNMTRDSFGLVVLGSGCQ